MKIPNADQAFVDLRKLRDYCLNPEHPRGRHKARLFKGALGWTADDAGGRAAATVGRGALAGRDVSRF